VPAVGAFDAEGLFDALELRAELRAIDTGLDRVTDGDDLARTVLGRDHQGVRLERRRTAGRFSRLPILAATRARSGARAVHLS